MLLTPSDPDIATIYRKIRNQRLDLQPNFQRGEVWGLVKKQRLIDSILRGWHIPPIHVVQSMDSEKQEVLDGQQRLVAIRDFIENRFPINGDQNPLNKDIKKLNGLFWADLPDNIKADFEDFTIRILTLTNYEVEEPGELFYRLNQPTNLTSAEQRNAFFSETRQQIKDLSSFMVDALTFNTSTLGFSNSRMAYDDIVAKLLITLEYETLRKKITANIITSRFREGESFSMHLIEVAKQTLFILSKLIQHSNIPVKLNKATTLTWLIFIYKYKSYNLNQKLLVDFFRYFENNKQDQKNQNELMALIYLVYQDRSSARVADTASVVLRDFSLWSIFVLYCRENNYNLSEFDELKKLLKLVENNILENSKSVNEKDIENLSNKLNWGAEI